MNSLQPKIEAKGQAIFDLMKEAPKPFFDRRGITRRLMDWSMKNEALKTQLFRFVDVLPALGSSKEIAQHARDYLGQDLPDLPQLVKAGSHLAPRTPWLTAMAARQSVARMARTFITAENAEKALPELERMRAHRSAFTVDVLGEAALSEQEAETYQQTYIDLLEKLTQTASQWNAIPQIDHDHLRPLPRVNLSIKISALYSQIHPADPETALSILQSRLRPILQRARDLNAFINFDMESTSLKNLTYSLFLAILADPEFEGCSLGLAVQAYLKETEKDLLRLIDFLQKHDQSVTVRLIKGAYWDYETILAKQRHWPIPVFQKKSETDANYEKCASLLLDNPDHIQCAFGTHSVRSIAACIALAEEKGTPANAYEFQMLFGMAEPIKHALVQLGYRLREYCPIGEILPGMSYLVRRLLENTSNEGFLRATFAEHTPHELLLRDPQTIQEPPAAPVPYGTVSKTLQTATDSAGRVQVQPSLQAKHDLRGDGRDAGPPLLPLFRNEPWTDFTLSANRQRMQDALTRVKGQLGRTYPAVIAGREHHTTRQLQSFNPAQPDQLIGSVAVTGSAEAEAAIVNARLAQMEWRKRPVADRAKLLEQTARLLRQQRFVFAAWEILETGKPWIESDADVCEAIDFCEFYALEMRRLAAGRYLVPGEESLHTWTPRGLAAIIAPWNFPLAILCGMTAAALVTGNAVLIKPAEQSSVIGALFMQVLQNAGLPAGVVQFLPGYGEEIGEYLVDHPQTDLIAFTGSLKVGLHIQELAGQVRPGQRQLKKVVCEMGGKNALIIDNDADLDEAIPAILSSAFGYSGQKCSALSRLILLEDTYQRVINRLLPAAASLRVGNPAEPGTIVGPVIDQDAHHRICDLIEQGKTEASLLFQANPFPSSGYFIPPTIFTDVPEAARIATEEIFGPVLSIFKVPDLDSAIRLANSSPYALTGGFFSRSPARIEKVKDEFLAGNLYINRTITGSIVGRHPFGGFKMSGTGSKAGGRDYLPHFMIPRVITENLMRRGFAPAETGERDDQEKA